MSQPSTPLASRLSALRTKLDTATPSSRRRALAALHSRGLATLRSPSATAAWDQAPEWGEWSEWKERSRPGGQLAPKPRPAPTLT